MIGRLPAARVGDGGPCGSSGTSDSAVRGNPLVLIGGRAAVGMTHATEHGGWIATGCASVYIGNPPTDGAGNLIPMPRECRFVWRLLEGAPANLDRLARPARVGPGQAATYLFRGMHRPLPAIVHVVVVRGHRVRVVLPGPGVPVAGELPTVQDIAAALGTLNDEQLAAVQEVALSPVPNPEDGAWQGEYENPGFYSAATMGGGVATVYPAPALSSDLEERRTWLRALMQHEAGHAVAQQMWTKDPSLQEAWKKAMRDDRRAVSAYGSHNADEDFAEAVLLFALTKGTPCEAAARAAFPGRYALLEKMFPNGYALPGKAVSHGR